MLNLLGIIIGIVIGIVVEIVVGLVNEVWNRKKEKQSGQTNV